VKDAEGVIPAPITPFTGEGAVDFPLLEKQAGYLRDAGGHGIMVGGTTAEGACLNRAATRRGGRGSPPSRPGRPCAGAAAGARASPGPGSPRMRGRGSRS
jgi:hypothetical protein